MLAVLLTALILTERQAAAEDDEPLRIRGVTYLADLPTLIADKRGLFEAEGVKPVVKYSFSGKRNMELLRAGETEYALTALTPVVIDMLGDRTPGNSDDPVILASVVHSTQLNQVVSLQGSGVSRPADLRGRRVGLMKGTNAEFIWWLFTTYHGLDPATVQVADRPLETLADALVAGEIDAAVLWEPWTTRLRQRVGDAVRVHAGSNVYTAKWVVVALQQTVVDQPDKTRALLNGYREAIQYIMHHNHAAFSVYADHAGVSMQSLRELRRGLSFDLSLNWSLIATLQQQVDWARNAGYAKEDFSPDVLSIVEPGPLASIAPTSVASSILGTDTGPDVK